jgi:hypothetical protein
MYPAGARPSKCIIILVIIITVAVPKYHQDLWQNIAYQATIDNPLVVCQTGQTEFSAYYGDEFREIRVGFVHGAEGEAHVVSLLPIWENQVIRIREAFCREMTQRNTMFASIETTPRQ